MTSDVETATVAAKRWSINDRLLVRSTWCTLAGAEHFTDCEGLRLTPLTPPDVPFGTLLVPFDRPRPVDPPPRPLRAMHPRRWLHAVRGAAAERHPFGGLRSAARARIDLLPYQLEPAIAVTRHAALRVLLADAVGLGKTIQAGLVLAEVLDRDSSRRALVAVPAGLRDQWQSELATHFAIDASVCDASWLRERTRELPRDANPWSLPGTYVVSLDFVKRPEVLNAIEERLWDVLIVDEAHTVTSGTDRRAAIDAIASRARRVLLLTGTPHSGDEAQFDALLRIGEGAAHTPLVAFRRTANEIGSAPVRRSTLLRVRLSEAERRMHELLNRYASRVWRESHARGDRRARLVAIVLRKRALSSAGSLAASVARRLDLLSAAADAGAVQLPLPLPAGEDEADDRVDEGVLGAPGLDNAAVERRWLGTLLEAARRAARDESKVARLRRFLRRIAEPAIVFTEYRDTLTRLERALTRTAQPVRTLHGGMPAGERRAVQQAFDAQPSLLLATDAASEGLNLQRRCRLVIHFELPWNPLRMEQRAGRVDRIGQTRRVHEIALVADDTAERVVLAPLARRAGKAKELATGGARMLELLSESVVAEAVMSGNRGSVGSAARVHVAWPDPQLAREAELEASRLADVRRWMSPLRSDTHSGAAVTRIRRRRTGDHTAIVLIYTLSLATADGRVAHAEPLVLRVGFGGHVERIRSTANAIRAVQQMLRLAQPHVDALIADRQSALAHDVLSKHTRLVAALRERERAIAGIRPSAARRLVQAGLFERRALREADAEHDVQTRRLEESEQTLRALASAESIAEYVSLDAALLEAGGRA